MTQNILNMLNSDDFREVITSLNDYVDKQIIEIAKAEYVLTEDNVSLLNSHGNFSNILEAGLNNLK